MNSIIKTTAWYPAITWYPQRVLKFFVLIISGRPWPTKIWSWDRLLVQALATASIVAPISVMGQVQDDTAIELSGFSISETFKIPEKISFDTEEPNLNRLLYRALQTSDRTLEQYSQYTSDVAWEQVVSDNAAYRARVFRRSGIALNAQRIPIAGSESEDPIRHVFKLNGQLEDGQPFQLVSLHLPRVWLNRDSLQQPIEFTGFLYTLIQEDGSAESVPMFITQRVAWFPGQADSDLGISDSHVMLSQHGVDIGGIETIMRQHGKKLTAVEAPFFFQFLTAAETIGNDRIPESFSKSFPKSLGAVELLKNFRQAHGEAVRFQARVRQCSVVQRPADSTDPGFQQYYQLIVFPDLGASEARQSIPLIPNTLDVMPGIEVSDGQQTLTYSRFPYTICARSLPEGMTPTDIENQQVMIEGFFYRFWKYEAEFTEAMGASGQLSPLIIVNQPRLVATSKLQLSLFINSFLVLFFLILLFAAWTSWRTTLRNRRILGESVDGTPLPDKLDTHNFDESN